MQGFMRGALVALVVGVLTACGGAKPVAVTVSVQGSDLQFVPAEVRVPVGATVALTFTNDSDLSHNFILVDGNEQTLTEVDAGADKAGDAGNYIPADMPGLVAHSGLLAPGTSEVVTFTAPAAGTYFFFCSYPSHLEGGMRGVLTVN